MNKKQLDILKLIFGLSLLFFVLYKVGFSNIYDTIKKMNILLVLLASLSFYLLFFILGAINLKILFDPIKKISFSKLFKYHTLSWTLGLFIPSKIGELSLVLLLKKEGLPIGKTTAICILDKIITLITFTIFSIIGFLIFFNISDGIKFIIIILAILFALIFSVLSKRVRNIIRRIIGKYHVYFDGFSKTLFMYLKNNRKIIAINFLLTLVKWCLINAGLVFIYFLAFGRVVNPLYVILITAITLTVGLIPITINGIGIVIPTAIFLYTKLGIEGSIVAGVHIIDLVVKYIIAFLLFLFLFKREDYSLK